MAKQLGKTRIWVEYAGFMLCYGFLTYFPVRIAKAGAKLLADLWRCADKKHQTLAIRQSMERLGLSEGQARLLVRDNYRHYALFAMETARLRRMPIEEVMRRTNLNGGDAVLSGALAKGKGIVVVTGHLGNWEWGAVVLGTLDVAEGLIARQLDNPLIDAFIRNIRQRTGAEVWNKFGSMRKALAALRRGKGFVAVMDQDAGRRGYPAPFLGKNGSTMAAPVDLAIRTGAPLFVGAMIRDAGGGTFSLVSKGVHWPVDGADPEEEKKRLTSSVNADLSELIREYPEQWIWTHRRWKTTLPQLEDMPI